MFKRLLPFLTGILIAIAPIASAQVQDLFWDRLDRLMQHDGWKVTGKGDAYRRMKCTNCKGDIVVTISATELSPDIQSEYTASQAYRAYRIEKCRTLVQSGEGRCINEQGLADIGDGRVEHETVFFYGQVIIWGHATGPKGNQSLSQTADPLMRHLMKSLTPLY